MTPPAIPPLVRTVTATGPAEAAAGTVTVSWPSESTVNTAVCVPNRTSLVVDRPRPVKITVLPPARGPAGGGAMRKEGGGR